MSSAAYLSAGTKELGDKRTGKEIHLMGKCSFSMAKSGVVSMDNVQISGYERAFSCSLVSQYLSDLHS